MNRIFLNAIALFVALLTGFYLIGSLFNIAPEFSVISTLGLLLGLLSLVPLNRIQPAIVADASSPPWSV
jgi:hypothetical protein